MSDLKYTTPVTLNVSDAETLVSAAFALGDLIPQVGTLVKEDLTRDLASIVSQAEDEPEGTAVNLTLSTVLTLTLTASKWLEMGVQVSPDTVNHPTVLGLEAALRHAQDAMFLCAQSAGVDMTSVAHLDPNT